MQLTLQVTRDTLTPDVLDKIRRLRDRTPILEAIGLQLVSLGKRSFNDATLRAAPWAPRKSGGSHALLKKSGTLWRSIRIISLSNDGVKIGSDRPYAAIHQLGGRTPAHIIRPRHAKALRTPWGPRKSVKHPGSLMPPRPYLPFFPSGQPTPLADGRIKSIVAAKLGLGLA